MIDDIAPAASAVAGSPVLSPGQAAAAWAMLAAAAHPTGVGAR
jgi:hypothetical protein